MMTLITGFTILVLQPSVSSLLQSATSVITKCDSFFYYKVRWSVITKCDSFFITKCDKCYYKVRQVLQSVTILAQSATIITKCDSTRYTQIYTPTVGQGGGGYMLQYFETILPS